MNCKLARYRCGAQPSTSKKVEGGAKWYEAAVRAMYLKVLTVAGKGDGLTELLFKNRLSK